VGNNGETLVADSSTTTGLRWQGDYAAGKTKIINGDFRINQRAFTSTTTSATYGFDRFSLISSDGTNTYSAETFTPGTAPVAGYESINFARLVSTGQTATSALTSLNQGIEDVRTFAGETITVSFWAKASSGTPNVVVWTRQNFGSGGSTIVEIGSTKKAISTSWARYSFTIAVPSISGKTIGTGSFLAIRVVTSAGTDRSAYTDSIGIQSATIDIWGVQAEAGSVATAFQTATGTIQGELAACQRYYFRANWAGETGYGIFGSGSAYSTTQAACTVAFPVPMRVRPTAIDYPTPATYFDCIDTAGNGGTISTLSFDANQTLTTNGFLSVTNGAANLTAYRPVNIRGRNSTDAYIGWTAEL
jgi:hypothetical protein